MNKEEPQIHGRAGLTDLSYAEANDQFMQIEQGITVQEFISTLNQRNLEQEFKFLRKLTETKDHQKLFVSLNPYIQSLNRYTNIIPYSHSLVKPESQQASNKYGTPRDKFYINANYIKSITNQEKAYIATQGPTNNSIPDFWHMVWTNNVGLIVMLCNLSDNGRKQCEKYWPSQGENLQLNPYEITNVESKEKMPHLYENQFIMRSKEENERLVTQLFWTGWPDFGVPNEDLCFQTMDYLAEQVHQCAVQGKRPVVHCSAGIGRTGTLLAICKVRHLLTLYKEQGIKDGKISIFSIVRRLREQRAGMINTADQYRLVYRYALWLIEHLK